MTPEQRNIMNRELLYLQKSKILPTLGKHQLNRIKLAFQSYQTSINAQRDLEHNAFINSLKK